ncbi:TetR family transcriptional regulator [Streptomyces sp. GESEQ-35]|uniref:SbtR family transcriptional regulator n=1 Tax=Streptomyces sp. GESEQ-35 TaxID=2812657 RepID=UPI001FF2EE18|nr:TetR family transcriptional regulator [Streptomyces sp. GESEQ-35]
MSVPQEAVAVGAADGVENEVDVVDEFLGTTLRVVDELVGAEPAQERCMREALLDALLRTSFDEMTEKAGELETSNSPEDALVSWLRDCVAWTTEYRGVTVLMAAAIDDTESALHASCVTLRAAGARLLARAQAAGTARSDIDGADLFALVAMLAWLGDQPSLAPRSDRLFDVVASAILPSARSGH